MKQTYFLTIVMNIFLIISGCSKVTVTENSNADTMFYTELSASESFDNIYFADTFFVKSKNKYSLSPDNMDMEYWMGDRADMRRPQSRLYYARIVGVSGDRIFFLSNPTLWQNIGTALWVNSTGKNETNGFYIRSDEQGNIILKNEKGEQKITEEKFEEMNNKKKVKGN